MTKAKATRWQQLLHLLRWLGLVVVIMAAVFLAKLVLGMFYGNDSVSGNSMQPTLRSGDRLVIATQAKIARNDIVTLASPERSGEQYIKRVIGMPGDTVRVKNERLYINGKVVAQPYLKPAFMRKALSLYDLQNGSVGGGTRFTADFSLSSLKATKQAKVPAGHYFVLGDNRPVSYDSRKFGFVSRSAIYGVVQWRYWPLNRIHHF